MEVQRDGSLEKGSVDLVIGGGSGKDVNLDVLPSGGAPMPNSHNTISYNDHNSDSYE
jgi:hypothetical protein